ncbi:DUF3817 domain-containing protein [Brevibacterium litoralis]|uniref:DUF3817 domain-containing protein n=1 Tax=Brevibacterium litoralis TaxID=3138935 RepID=UPI0032EFBBFF
MSTDDHDMDARPDFDPATAWTVNRYTSARNALRFYRPMAIITGVMLLIMCVEMILKYIVFRDDPSALVFGPFDLGRAVPIAHGWVYVVYLISCFWLNTQMKWSIGRLVVLALAGVVPVLSFFMERKLHKEAEQTLEDVVVIAPAAGR